MLRANLDADPRRVHQIARLSILDYPKFAFYEVSAVHPTVYPESLSQLARAAAQVPEHGCAPRLDHKVNPRNRLESADQNRLRGTLGLSDGVQAPAGVDHVDVGVPGRTEHRPVAVRHPSRGMVCGIAGQVCLCLDDAAGNDAVGRLVKQDMADQPPSGRSCILQVELPTERRSRDEIDLFQWLPSFGRTRASLDPKGPIRL